MGSNNPPSEDDYSLMILKNRLAKGEITVEEFNSLKQILAENIDQSKKTKDESRFCPTCGYPVSVSDSFCTKCGVSIVKENPINSKKFSDDNKSHKKRSKKKVVLMVLIGIISFFVVTSALASMMGVNNTVSDCSSTINQQGNVRQQIDDAVNNAENSNCLTDTQKSMIKDMQNNCDSNESIASMQSDSAAKAYHRMCYDKIYDQMQQFKQKNNVTKTS